MRQVASSTTDFRKSLSEVGKTKDLINVIQYVVLPQLPGLVEGRRKDERSRRFKGGSALFLVPL